MVGIDFLANKIHAFFSHQVGDDHRHRAQRAQLVTHRIGLVLLAAGEHHPAASLEHHAGRFQAHATGATDN